MNGIVFHNRNQYKKVTPESKKWEASVKGLTGHGRSKKLAYLALEPKIRDMQAMGQVQIFRDPDNHPFFK